ncbi:MAG: hypothetical protein AAGJ93_10020, partial [Bacteroidota bacterium]
MDQVSLTLQLAFIFTTLISVYLLHKSSNYLSKTFLGIVAIWMLVQMAIGMTDFYTDTSGIPPRFAFLIIPPTLLLVVI